MLALALCTHLPLPRPLLQFRPVILGRQLRHHHGTHSSEVTAWVWQADELAAAAAQVKAQEEEALAARKAKEEEAAQAAETAELEAAELRTLPPTLRANGLAGRLTRYVVLQARAWLESTAAR